MCMPCQRRAAPGLVGEEGTLAKEVGFEEVVDLATALGGLLVHDRLTLLYDVELVSCVPLRSIMLDLNHTGSILMQIP